MTFTHDRGHLRAAWGDRELLIDVRDGAPVLRHFGAALGDDLAALDLLLDRPRAKGVLDVEAAVSVCPEHGSGWPGRPGIVGHRSDGSGWAPRFSAQTLTIEGIRATVVAVDEVAGLTLTSEFELQPASVRIRLRLTNTADGPYRLGELTIGVPVPASHGDLLHLTGRWSHEFQTRRLEWPDGALTFDNRRGRTSHDRVPCLWTGTAGFGETTGDVLGFTLGWSGNAVVTAERIADGRKIVQFGELLASGDVELGPGASYETPWLEVASSSNGLNGVSQAFHASVRAQAAAPKVERPRPVLLNTWEAVYFNHDLETLTRLADRAAEIGVERFVLDDGWFHGRRNDRAGLGDWWVDDTVWPEGLQPLIDHITGLGMEFGIWVEPEMVNPDSDLYRSHPEWALVEPSYDPVLGRQQLVLNLGRDDVRTYLFDHLHALLRDHDVRYVKWDMNRDLVHASSGPRAAMHEHMLGVYRLIDELRAHHPGVEIESCASGGGRADFEILKRTERIWTSDSNDAFERQRIQRGFSMLFPPEVMGAHIGPPRSHTSGRRHSLQFRAVTAFFGHLGIEWNLLETTDDERRQLADVVALHKRHRRLLHGGDVFRLDLADHAAIGHAVVAPDASEALVSFALLDLPDGTIPARVRLAGLDPERRYRVEILPVAGTPEHPAIEQVAWFADGFEATGRTLMELGLQPPMLDPESAVILHLQSSPPDPT